MKSAKRAIIMFALLGAGYVAVSCNYVVQPRFASSPLTDPEMVAAKLPHACDVEAAHNFDPMRYAAGKQDEEIIGVMAERACREAITQFPDEPRFHFQLGRALLAMKRPEEATEALQKAVALGSQPAKYYLATFEIEAYGEMEDESHLETARKLLEESASSFPPAAEQLDRITFTTDGFRHPQLIKALHEGDCQFLNRARILSAHYLNGFHKLLSSPWNPGGDDCPAYLVDPAINYDLEQAIAGDPRNTLERGLYKLELIGASWAGLLAIDPAMGGDPEKWAAYLEAQGERDARFLAHKYGCTSPVTKKIYKGVVQFGRAKRPLSEYGAELLFKGVGAEIFLQPGERITGGE